MTIMKEFFKRLIGKKDVIQQFSTTATDATEGSNAKRDLDPTIGPLIDRLIKGDIINNVEMNKLVQFYFNTGQIAPCNYKFNNSFIEGMTFQIDGVETETNEVKDIVNIRLSMREIVYNVDLVMRINVKDFHEFLVPIKPVEIE